VIMLDFKRKAFIKRATIEAQRKADQLDIDALNELQSLYQQASDSLSRIIQSYAAGDDSLRLMSMRQLLGDTNRFLDELSEVQTEILMRRMKEGAELGVSAVQGVIEQSDLDNLVNDSLFAARNFVAADGLQLSDRIWRIGNGAKEAVSRAIQLAIIQGNSASEAAQEFLRRGQPVPGDITSNLSKSKAGAVARQSVFELFNKPDSAYANARRLFRTEINRAHTIAYENSVSGIPDFVGTRFLLSPLHPEVDICDLYAKANRYGLGPGVYPKGKNPCPAHPNTLSYTEVVFEEDVGVQDKSGKITAEEWLRTQPRSIQEKVLGGRKKQQAFAAGLLKENQFRTPWRVLKERFEKQGVDTDNFIEKFVPPTLGQLTNPFSPGDRIPMFTNKAEAEEVLSAFADRVSLNGANLESMTIMANALNVTLAPYQIRLTELGWVGRLARNVNGLFVHTRSFSTFSLHVRKNHALKGREESKLEHAYFLKRQERSIARVSERLKRGGDVPKYVRELKELKTAFRFTVSSTSPDPLFATTAHEAGHAIMFAKGLMPAWARALDKYKVTKIDKLKVSEYAASDLDELFAEVTSLLAQGFESQVPVNILDAYKSTIDTIGG